MEELLKQLMDEVKGFRSETNERFDRMENKTDALMK